MPFQNNVLAGASAQGGYQITNSLRFRWSNTGYLSRTAGASPTNDKIFTWAGWVKLGLPVTNNADYGVLFTGYTASSDAGFGVLTVSNPVAGFPAIRVGGWATNYRITSAAFRDPSAWYHIVMAVDTTQATAADRIKLYVNGTQITSFGTSNNPALNATMGFNNASSTQRIGLDAPASSAYHFDGYMAHVYFIDGQALTPASFGQTDATTGVWVPKAYSGTYGNNGFFLQFKNAASTTTIGYDSSGNSNNFTTSGISVTSGTTFDQMTDTPTLNYCTFSSIDQVGGTNTLTAGLDITTSAGAISAALGTIYVSTGKWYWEFTANGVAGITQVGVAKAPVGTISTNGPGQSANAYVYLSTGTKGNNNSFPAYGATYTTNDVIGVGLDMDAGTLTFYKNNTSQGQAYSGLTGDFAAIVGDTGAAATISGSINFGQRAFAYTPPSGFKALNTANLSVPTIKKPSLYMDATLRTGTGATASVSSLGFQPDLVWIKSRSAATDHGLYDSVRGVQKQIESNTTTGETTETTGLTAFNSNGYTVGSLAQLNTNTATYVDWAWKKGITPGFDIVTYTGNGTNRTISHSLGAAPKFMTVKRLDTGNGWPSYHVNQNASPASGYMYLNSTAGFAAASTMWNSTAPTSSVFSVGTNSETNGNTFSFVAYLWAEIDGYSKFSSYTGNASADGPFVWCGFRPRWIMIKDATAANLDWRIYDTVRETYNEMGGGLEAGDAAAENYATSVRAIDVLSNGFKIRVSASGLNGSGVTYVFAAFAEAPFKYARAR